MEIQRRKPRASRMDSVSEKYVPDDELQDTPSRLFRQLMNKLEMNPRKWANYLRDYLNYVVTTEDPQRAKSERTTRQGNIKETFFQKKTLTFNKLLEGLSILRMKTCKVIIEAEDEDGNVYIVEETIRIVGRSRLEKPLPDEEPTPSKK